MSSANEFPSANEWREIYNASPFPSLLPFASGPYGPPRGSIDAGIDRFAQAVTLRRLELELHNRVVDVARSYVFMKFFYSQGIPDERWYVSPGRGGQSVEYFPDFQESHFIIKGWFDFYADTFYQKLFAAWSVVGHILNALYSLGLEGRQVDFAPAVDRLGADCTGLAITLSAVLEDDAFSKARQLRNDITHNEAPASVGMTVTRYKTDRAVVYGMGMRAYITSTEVIGNAAGAVALLRRTIEALPKEAT